MLLEKIHVAKITETGSGKFTITDVLGDKVNIRTLSVRDLYEEAASSNEKYFVIIYGVQTPLIVTKNETQYTVDLTTYGVSLPTEITDIWDLLQGLLHITIRVLNSTLIFLLYSSKKHTFSDYKKTL